MSNFDDSHNNSPQTYEPVVPTDLTRGSYHSAMGPPPQHTVRETRSSSDTSNASLKSPRTARFAEATSIHSPIERTEAGRSPFADPPKSQAQSGGVGDLGFGYVAANNPAQHADDQVPMSPFRPDLKVPQTAKSLNPLSPTFREEYMLEKQEKKAEVENARDLRIKLRVRIAKVFLRFVSFGCSLIVLSLLAVTLTVFNATKSLPTRNNLPAWAAGTNPWAQYLLLGMACVSLVACLIVFWAYRKGGHKRAEKAAVYYTSFSIAFFAFNLIMWIVGAAIYQHSKATGEHKDMWGWSCAQNTREEIYHNSVDYALLCRLQDWGLVCAIIEVVIEVLIIIIYVVVFYRIWSKRKLMKSMDTRDNARSDLYLAQLRLQSAPNTPGFAGFSSYPPKSPSTPLLLSTLTRPPRRARLPRRNTLRQSRLHVRLRPSSCSPRLFVFSRLRRRLRRVSSLLVSRIRRPRLLNTRLRSLSMSVLPVSRLTLLCRFLELMGVPWARRSRLLYTNEFE
ncbi:uncharacterized protein N7446_001681 [Penicillium canescens]|uniref:uncharacterized protein n=1 Tax=Penicillium canescens TaxID=5083 RepID=UPI0026DF0A3B|nr:uncharacterized protein N7446_001681 [Penicillium canescens]KAJ6073904.1 hypothetical protein N7446_001681 [Penicillium canescens]